MRRPGATAVSRPAGAAIVAFAALVVLLAGPLASLAPAEPEAGVTVTAKPRWGGVQPGGWTPYSVIVRNDGAANLAGDVVLTQRAEAGAETSASTTRRSTAPAQPVVTEPQPVLAVGNRAVTAPPPLLLAAAAASLRWPSYRVPVVVRIGSEKTLTVMVRAAPFGYDVEVQDRRRGTVASAVGTPALAARTAVLLVSDVQGADVVLKSLNQPAAADVEVTQARSVYEFPDSALEFAGLNGVVIDDFDTSSLGERQRQALQDYVAFGGALVVAGGASWRRTLDGIPPELTPVRFSGTTLASVGPLADLAAAASASVASVAIGTIAAGQKVVGAPEGPPLVVEFAYGAGRVIQLAYDPLAEPLSSDPAVRGPAWDQALMRMLNPRGSDSSQNTLAVADQLGWSAVAGLAAPGWPRWPSWMIGLIIGYAVAVLPATVAMFGRRRAKVTVAILLPASMLIVAIMLFAPMGSRVRQSTIEVRTVASNGATLHHVYRAVVGLDQRDSVTVPPGAATSTIVSSGSVFRVGGPGLGSVEQTIRLRPMRGGAGGGVVRTGPTGTEVRFGSGRREVHEVETVSFSRGGQSLDAALRLVAPSGTSPARLTGSVTNRGSSPLHGVRAQFRGGQATLADGLAPGESRPVDAPVIAVARVEIDSRLAPAAPHDVVAFAAASQAVTSADQVALVATIGPPAARGSMPRGGTRHITAVVTVVPIQSGSILPAGSGGARMVSLSRANDGESVTTFDLETIPGVGPLSIEYIGAVVAPGAQPPDRTTVEIYDWTTGRWRSVPSWRPAAGPGQVYDPRLAVALEPAELNQGLARIRTRTIGPSEITPRLLLTGSTGNPG